MHAPGTAHSCAFSVVNPGCCSLPRVAATGVAQTTAVAHCMVGVAMAGADEAAQALAKLQKKVSKLQAGGGDEAKLKKLQKKLKKAEAAAEAVAPKRAAGEGGIACTHACVPHACARHMQHAQAFSPCGGSILRRV